MNRVQGYEIDEDKSRLNVDLIHEVLASSYWAKEIPKDIVLKSIEGADCFGIYKSDEQVGFARVISDHATFAYLADVFVIPSERGKGLASWLLSVIMGSAKYKNLRRWMLATRDAHHLYRKAGFKEAPPNILMEIRDWEVYARLAAQSSK